MDKTKTEELLQIYYDWDRLEKDGIIDFDLVGRREEFPRKYHSLSEIQQALTSVNNDSFPVNEEDRFIQAKIKGSLVYLEVLLGKTIPFNEYILKTMGIKPQLFSKECLDTSLDSVKKAFQEIGVEYSQDGLNAYKKSERLYKDEIVVCFKEFGEKWVTKIMDFLGFDFNLDYVVECTEEDAYWMNSISTGKDGKIILKFNLHKRHPWAKGWVEVLAIHELGGHFLQTSSWKKQIKDGKMNPVCGLTTLFTCEQFLMEGIAESLRFFLPFNPFSKEGEAVSKYDQLDWLVTNNTHILANTGKSRKEVYEFDHYYLPDHTTEELESDLQGMTQNLSLKAYLYSYGVGLYYHQKLAERFNQGEKKIYLQEIYSGVLRPEEIGGPL